MFKKNFILFFVISLITGYITNTSFIFKIAPKVIKESKVSQEQENYKIKESLNDLGDDIVKEEMNVSINKPDFEITNSIKEETEKLNIDNNIEHEENVELPIISNVVVFDYDRTTRIYENDNVTLIRVEYYKNNKLVYYSRVEDFDVSTSSYIEKIYMFNDETNSEVLIRTDIYLNNILTESY